MIIQHGINGLPEGSASSVTVGKFDGLHLGHQKIIGNTVDYARKHGLLAVVCSIVQPGVPRIFTEEETAEMLSELGVDVFVTLPFTEAFKNTAAEVFLDETLLGRLRMHACFSGMDFRFGKGLGGDPAFLTEAGKAKGFYYEMVPDVCLGGETVRSSLIRERLKERKAASAAKLLGRAYSISGTVLHGRKLGSRIGFPTVNIQPPEGKFLPGFGVYAALLTVYEADGSIHSHEGVLDLGVKPTVEVDGRRQAEVHLFDFNGDLYGKRVKASILREIRPERRFASVTELRMQIAEDVKNVQTLFKEYRLTEAESSDRISEL